MQVIVEEARDGSLTCKAVGANGTERYLYSKYRPLDAIGKGWGIDPTGDYVVLGLGLGYEARYLAEKTTGKVYVIDCDRAFFTLIQNEESLKGLLDLPNVVFLFGSDYLTLTQNRTRPYRLINNHNLTKLHAEFFANVLLAFSGPEPRAKEKVVFFDHPTIADDCMQGLDQLGYHVVKMNWSPDRELLLMTVANEHPKYLMTINFSPTVATISKTLAIPYISWTVDTPAYSLYSEQVQDPLFFVFHYDEAIVQTLQARGVENIYYLPVAADTDRFDSIEVTATDRVQYACDLSFVANVTVSEYSQLIEPRLSEALRTSIHQILEKQTQNPNEFLIPPCIQEEWIERIVTESGYAIQGDTYLTKAEKLAFLLGRKQSEMERQLYVSTLANAFSVKVFGNEEWLKQGIDGYGGPAEHFTEMPKIFKSSKVNLNITRTFVESGLPMRVFDVLGCQGFLVTNDKADIRRYFADGRDLVVYRDLQDLVEIVRYFLDHEQERTEIAYNGYQTVKHHHTYPKRLSAMMQRVKTKLGRL